MEVRQEQCPAPGDLALETVREWTLWLTEVERGLMPHFARCEARHRAWAYLRGLRSPVERKNGGQLAEVNGDATPYGLQHLLGRARWDADAVRDDLRAYLVTLFWDAGVFCSDVVRAASRVCKAVEKEGLQGGEQDKSRGGAIGTSTTLASNKSHYFLVPKRLTPIHVPQGHHELVHLRGPSMPCMARDR